MLEYELLLNYYEYGNLNKWLKERNIKSKIKNQNTEEVLLSITTTRKIFQDILNYIQWLYI